MKRTNYEIELLELRQTIKDELSSIKKSSLINIYYYRRLINLENLVKARLISYRTKNLVNRFFKREG